MDQRTRERLPTIAALAQIARHRHVDAQTRLAALRKAAPGEAFTVLGEAYVKVVQNPGLADGSNWAYDSTGTRRQFLMAEHRSFWAWVAVELADVLATIVSRVCGDTGAVPLVAAYNVHEKIWNDPMPRLFQYRAGGRNHAITHKRFDLS